jgi:hypothetical protein
VIAGRKLTDDPPCDNYGDSDFTEQFTPGNVARICGRHGPAWA